MRTIIADIAAKQINNRSDVSEFFDFCVNKLEIGMGFHPDTSFEYYINRETELETFTRREAKVLDGIMLDCFDFCDRTDTDIYEIGMETIKPFLS